MKKYLSIFLALTMALSLTAVSVSAAEMYPAETSSYPVIGDWDFTEATADDNYTITGENYSYENGGLKLYANKDEKLPAVAFKQKNTRTLALTEYLYAEVELDVRNLKRNQMFRWYLCTVNKEAEFFAPSKDGVEFYAMTSGGKGESLGFVSCPEFATMERVKIGYYVNLSTRHYVGYVNGRVVLDGTCDSSRNAAITTSKITPMNSATSDDNSVIIYDYKWYALGRAWNADPAAYTLTEDNVTGTADTFAVDTTNGIKVTTATDGAKLPTITLPSPSITTQGWSHDDAFYYELVVNTDGLSVGSYDFQLLAASTTNKYIAKIRFYRDKIEFVRGDGDFTVPNHIIGTYNIPEDKRGKDLTIGIYRDRNEENTTDDSPTIEGTLRGYVDGHLVADSRCHSRTGYYSYGTITLSTEAAGSAGDSFEVKSVRRFIGKDGSDVIPPSGTFTAVATYDKGELGESDTEAKATVTLTMTGDRGWRSYGAVIIASYTADGRILDIVLQDNIIVRGGTPETVEASVQVEKGGKVKAFLWDSLKTMIPLTTLNELH